MYKRMLPNCISFNMDMIYQKCRPDATYWTVFICLIKAFCNENQNFVYPFLGDAKLSLAVCSKISFWQNCLCKEKAANIMVL